MEDFEFETEERSWIVTGLINFTSGAMSAVMIVGLFAMFGG